MFLKGTQITGEYLTESASFVGKPIQLFIWETINLALQPKGDIHEYTGSALQ